MARVTVEDCIDHISNRFQLVLVAANRSKKLSRGVTPCVKRDNDKNPVLALREIADNRELSDELVEDLVTSLQKIHVDNEVDVEEEQELDMEKDWSEQIAQLSRELESLGSVEEDLEAHMSIEGEDALDSDDEDDSSNDFTDADLDEDK